MINVTIVLEKNRERDFKKIVEKANNVYEEIPKTLGLKPYKREYYLLFLYTIFAYMAEFMDEDNQKLEKIIEMLKSEIEYSSRDLDEKFVMERIFGYASSENNFCLLGQIFFVHIYEKLTIFFHKKYIIISYKENPFRRSRLGMNL